MKFIIEFLSCWEGLEEKFAKVARSNKRGKFSQLLFYALHTLVAGSCFRASVSP